MARNRSADFLPELFKTDTNKEFLGSTLDQLTQEPKLKQTQGFVGRQFGYGIGSDDSYIIEPTNERSNYQLEPGIVFEDDDKNVSSAITYPELIDSLKTHGGNVKKHDRLFSSPIYSWSPLIDFDKFVNHSQYYWLPGGTNSVDVSASVIMLTDTFEITNTDKAYNFSGVAGSNPQITLARGGEYKFNVSQPGHNFYIQTELGTSGVLAHSQNISSRDVMGVVNNGEDGGTIVFSVPEANSQQFYYDLPEVDSVDLATFERFDSINGHLLSNLKHIDGITDLEGKTIVFLSTIAGNSADLGWQYLNLHEDTPFESDAFDETTYIDNKEDRYSVYQIEFITGSNNKTIVKLNKIKAISNLEKFDILYGKTYSNKSLYKNSSGYFHEIPLLSASHNTLYYQDASDENKFGIINLVNSTNDAYLNVDVDIVGKKTYTSPNGVELTNGLKIIFRGNVMPNSYQDKEYYVEGVGKSIVLVATSKLITPETYTTSDSEPFDYAAFDATNFDGNLNSPTKLDFITINRASNDLNPWTRSNRWVHKSVIEKTAQYNNTVAVFDNNFRATRPIIEFHANLKLHNFGTESKTPVTVIDFNETDAFSNINGLAGFTVDGITVPNGSRVIFANDADDNIKNKIYNVTFVDLEGTGTLTVKLSETEDASVSVNQHVLCTNGSTLQGKTYRYNGTEWIASQQKNAINQAPLFDVFDLNGISLTDSAMYPKSTFNGTKLFSYKPGTGTNDKVLGFPLSFLNIDNLGDIVFDNNLYIDTFSYGTPLVIKNVSDGYVAQYSSLTNFSKKIGWTEFVQDSSQSQIFNFRYDNTPLILDIIPKPNLSIPAIKVYVNGEFILSDNYITTVSNKTVIEFKDSYILDINSDVKVAIISNEQSNVAYYNIPKNLENNPFNENSTTLTLGTIRNHYSNLGQNLLDLTGDINGVNNSRDLGNIEQFGDTIIQNSSPVVSMGKFLDSTAFNFFESLEFSDNSYSKFKLKILNYVEQNDTYYQSANVILDHALESINAGKSITSPFYKSDMLAGAYTPTIIKHVVTPVSTSVFNIVNIYDFTKANNKSLLVYLNDTILIKDLEYTVAVDTPNIDVLVPLSNDDIILVKEFETTVGSYVPNTPTKLGLHPKYQPSKYLDDTYITPVNVIQGHDGSITVAYNDIRDDVLLEFETRIYNNIKCHSKIPVRDIDIIPGKFRITDYNDSEVTSILSNSLLNWVGWNRINYKTQDFLADNEFSWNYSTCSSKLDNSSLKGHWRGIYNHYYDTDTPHLTPWEMLGITEKPTWWENEYGPVPYTSGNLVLWDDLENGLIKEPGNNKVDARFKRENLTKVIPVDVEGNLLNPFVSIVQNYSKPDFKKSWVIGDCGPAENAWRRSSSYPFALQRLFALTKPAQYFALSIDRDKYVFNESMNQYLLNSRYRFNIKETEVQTTAQPKHSYINWIADYHNNNGCSCVEIKKQLEKIDVRLCYRMASFTDKNYLKIYTDKSSPDSSNTGLLIPDQSYDLILHKNEPLVELQYSAVVVQKTADGYTVTGHSKTQQYFEIYNSIHNSTATVIGDYVIPNTFTNDVTLVPYGYVFTTKGSVVDFLSSYGAFLESKGLVFSTVENSNELNWGRMAHEFLSWSGQEWGTGSIVNLNPGAISLEFNKELLIVDSINDVVDALDQNGIPLSTSDYVITRLDNSFKITTINNKSINYLKIKSVSYEHLLVLDNVSVFNDLLYKAVTGLRQQRIRLVGFTTFDWNGQLDAQGFILNQDNIKDWNNNSFYSKGDIVKFKNSYWGAVRKLEPHSEFNYVNWNEINYDHIIKGLLPNITNKAGQITEYYNKKTSNLESDVDLLAMGLIGFRPRSYLSSLSDISQVNFYSEFVANKGTTKSANVFKNVKFDKKITDYEIFENWAIREATFGNSDNKTFVEFELNNSNLQNNPSIVEVVDNASTSTTGQIIKLSDIYDQSITHTNKNIFPTQKSRLTNTNLPTAGFVKTNDVDIALYEISNLNGAAGVPFMRNLTAGSLIWVAKDTQYDWNVYRSDIHSNIKSIISGEVDTEITFYHNHDFVNGNVVVIQNISLLIDGAYTIDKVISDKVVTITETVSNIFVNIATDSSITCDTNIYTADHKLGAVYKLTSVRIHDMSNLTDSYIDQLPVGTNVWMNSNNNERHAVYQKSNDTWTLLYEEQDTVNTTLINRVMLTDKLSTGNTHDLDYLDPLNGKILSSVSENIDYISAIDPSSYSQGTNTTGIVWSSEHVGEMWWDTSNVRFLDYNQADLNYASVNWGQLFPGSTVDIRQWVESELHPSQYKGPGSIINATDYTTVSRVDTANNIKQTYYFWVSNSGVITNNKTLSTNTIENYIKNPITSGIGFVGFLNSSTIGIYNSSSSNDSSILHISYSQSHNENGIFNEYSLIKENNKHDFLSDTLYKKLQDSFVGGNLIGLEVPNRNLTSSQRLGINFRPRQSMFKNRFNALQEYLTQVNAVIKQHIITTNRNFDLLNSSEVAPGASTNKWDITVADINELNYQNLNLVAVGYKYLVLSDTNNNSGWSIYEVVSGPKLELIQVQTYDTTRAWTYIDWFESIEAENAIVSAVVSDSSKLTSLSVSEESYVKVSSNSTGKFEIYQLRSGYWVRVGLEDGTIKFNDSLWDGNSTYSNISIDSNEFTSDNVVIRSDTGTNNIELRNVIQTINKDLLIDELLIHRNKLLISVFKFILSEQDSVNWLSKTSLIDVEHKVRDLEQYTTYKKDNQDFLLEYLNESKPYHAKIKEFLLKYNGSEQYNTDVADFDVPVYYDNAFERYISPVLDHDGTILKSDQSNFDDDGVGLTEVDYNIWELNPWDNWYNNRTLSVSNVIIVDQGINYTQAPIVNVNGGNATTQAVMTAKVNNSGNIIEIVVESPGEGYTSNPSITLVGGNGTGAIITPVMQNTLVRTVNTTLNYNRCEYSSTVLDWKSNTLLQTTIDQTDVTTDNAVLTIDSYDNVYELGQLVRHNNTVYSHNVTRAFKTTFLTGDFTIVNPSTLSAADRTMGYYTPGVNDPGLNLPMLINGIEYPGTIVSDLDFDDNTEINTEYSGSFSDLYLGTLPEDINTDGGSFINTYDSHAPEELIPGSIFDTLDLTVHTRPGFDYQNNGHAFETRHVLNNFTPSSTIFTFDNVVEHIVAIKVVNITTSTSLNASTDYIVNWSNKTIEIIDNAYTNDIIQIFVYEMGGGNQLYRNTYTGDEFINSLVIPVESQSIYDIVIVVNGEYLKSGFTSSSDGTITTDSLLETVDSTTLTVDKVSLNESQSTTISFSDKYDGSDFVSVTVFGHESTQHEFSYPITRLFTPYGADTTLYTADLNNMTVDNVSIEYALDTNTEGKNNQNAIVEHNGKRLRPPEAKRYTGNGSTTQFRLPTVGGVDHVLVSNSEINVFVDNTKQILNTHYTVVSVVDGVNTYKEVSFIIAPETDKIIDTYITSIADYTINNSILSIKSGIVVSGLDTISVTTWNDTSQLDLLTSSFKGPSAITTPVIELFDSGSFDMVEFDYVGTSSDDMNLFDLGRSVNANDRVWVTLNGNVLHAEIQYTISDNLLLLAGELIGPTDIVTVTSMTSVVVPDKLSFKFFKDMNGSCAMYKVVSNSIKLKYDLGINDDVIYFDDVSNLTLPNLELGIFGIVLIDAERITYRSINTDTNSISGLRRGSAGTAINTHTQTACVQDISITNVVTGSAIKSNTLGTDINVVANTYDSIWYARGSNTVSNGIALQNQTTAQANFIKK